MNSFRWYPHTAAAGALLLGCVLYLTARPASLFYVGGNLTAPFIGQMPTFLHTLAFALASGLVFTRRDYAIAAIVGWGVVEALAEIAQLGLIPLPAVLRGYQQASTFDVLDLASILAAVIVAVLINHKMRWCRNEVR